MQIMVTHGSMARTRVLQFNRWQLSAMLAGLVIVLTLLAGTAYSLVFLKATREGWPIVSKLVRPVVRDESGQRDRYMRENLDAMAQRLGELQAKLIKLEAMGERVSTAVGVKPDEIAPLLMKKIDAIKGDGTKGDSAKEEMTKGDARGGPYVPLADDGNVSLGDLRAAVGALDLEADQHADLFTLLESRWLETRLQSLMVPNSAPVNVPVGSGFGFRSDPFLGRMALHTGLDFPAPTGTLVHAAAGGVVLSAAVHPEYGNLVEIDHGNGLVTRYAHNSKMLVKTGDLIQRGQVISEVGTTGRSTGAHLHFEVLVDGVPQNPAKFLAGGALNLAARKAEQVR